MSIDVAIVNLDKREFLRPLDMGLRSEIRAVECVPTLFHVALLRLVASASPWAGDRVALIHDAGGSPGLPSWETVMSRTDWRNILPAVVQDLIERHRPAMDEQYNGRVPDLLRVLAEHIDDLDNELTEARADAEDGSPEGNIVAIERDLDDARAILELLRAAGHDAPAQTEESKDTSLPKDYYVYHAKGCGTEYRGCAPDCPKDIYERTGEWTGPIVDPLEILVVQLRIDDENPIELSLRTLVAPRGSDPTVLHVARHVLVGVRAPGTNALLTVQFGRADRAAYDQRQRPVSADESGWVFVEVPVPRGADESSDSAVPCFLSLITFGLGPSPDATEQAKKYSP